MRVTPPGIEGEGEGGWKEKGKGSSIKGEDILGEVCTLGKGRFLEREGDCTRGRERKIEGRLY